MDILNLTKELCKRKGIVPSRSKGQNFLVEENVYDKILAAADLKKTDMVLEVGPGLGFLTELLARRVKQVIAVELDDKLAQTLGQRLNGQGIKNVTVLNEDILKFSIFNFQFSNNFQFLNFQYQNKTSKKIIQISDPRSTIHDPRSTIHDYKIVANLPYNITSFFLRKFLENEPLRPELMVLMVQKEVAERICAGPGKMSILAVSVQFFSQPEIIGYVPKTAFWPEPEVDSAIIKLEVRNKKLVPSAAEGLEVRSEKEFFRLVRIGFSAKRKKLANNLAGGYQITKEEAKEIIKNANLSENIRAQDLSMDDWEELFKVCYNNPRIYKS